MGTVSSMRSKMNVTTVSVAGGGGAVVGGGGAIPAEAPSVGKLSADGSGTAAAGHGDHQTGGLGGLGGLGDDNKTMTPRSVVADSAKKKFPFNLRRGSTPRFATAADSSPTVAVCSSYETPRAAHSALSASVGDTDAVGAEVAVAKNAKSPRWTHDNASSTPRNDGELPPAGKKKFDLFKSLRRGDQSSSTRKEVDAKPQLPPDVCPKSDRPLSSRNVITGDLIADARQPPAEGRREFITSSIESVNQEFMPQATCSTGSKLSTGQRAESLPAERVSCGEAAAAAAAAGPTTTATRTMAAQDCTAAEVHAADEDGNVADDELDTEVFEQSRRTTTTTTTTAVVSMKDPMAAEDNEKEPQCLPPVEGPPQPASLDSSPRQRQSTSSRTPRDDIHSSYPRANISDLPEDMYDELLGGSTASHEDADIGGAPPLATSFSSRFKSAASRQLKTPDQLVTNAAVVIGSTGSGGGEPQQQDEGEVEFNAATTTITHGLTIVPTTPSPAPKRASSPPSGALMTTGLADSITNDENVDGRTAGGLPNIEEANATDPLVSVGSTPRP